MKYLSVAEARNLPGLRLVLTAGVPGPWGEAAKAVFAARNVAYAPVEQTAMAPNEELVEWTGQRNAPTACLDDEPPLTGWRDMIHLAERLGTGPSLLPATQRDRALCLGYVAEIAGPDGFGWNRRLQIMSAYLADEKAAKELQPMITAYGVTTEAATKASARLTAIMAGLAEQLHRQAEAGSAYLIGDGLTALDLYWACFSMMVRPLPAEVNPMPDWLRPLYTALDPMVDAAVDPILIAHRDHIYQRHIGLPLDY